MNRDPRKSKDKIVVYDVTNNVIWYVHVMCRELEFVSPKPTAPWWRQNVGSDINDGEHRRQDSVLYDDSQSV